MHRGGSQCPICGMLSSYSLLEARANAFGRSPATAPSLPSLSALSTSSLTSHFRTASIRKCDVNDAVESAERDGRLGAVAGERPKAFALASSKEYDDSIPHIGHWLPPRCI